MKKIALTIFIVFSLFGFAGCDNLPNDIGSAEQVAAWRYDDTVYGIFAFHPKITMHKVYYDFNAVDEYHYIFLENKINDTFGSEDHFADRFWDGIVIKGNTLYIYYRFPIDDNKTKIDWLFNVFGYIISDDGIIADDLTVFSIPITLGV